MSEVKNSEDSSDLPEDNLDQKKSQKNSSQFKILIVLLVLLAFVTSITLIYWQFNNKGSFYSVKVQGIPVDKSINIQQFNASISSAIQNYQFSIIFPGQEPKQYNLSDIGYTFNSQKTYQNAITVKTKGSLLQKLRFWHKINVPIVYEIDEQKQDLFLNNKTIKIIDKPTNASLAFSGVSVVIKPEQTGSAYYDPQLKDKLEQAAKHLEPISVSLSKQTMPAKITAQSLKNLKPQIEKSLQQSVKLTINQKTYTADASIIKKWIDLPDFSKAEQFIFEVNSGNIQKYIDDITYYYTRKGKAQVILSKSDGTKKIIAQGYAGQDVEDKQDIAKDIAANIKNGQSYTKVLDIVTTPMQVVDAKNYDKWIVVDLTNKYLEAYEKDTVIRKYYVSAGAPETPTATGQFTIRYKVRRQDMRGLNVDGSSYFQANVEYVNYFYGGQAIHGNYWRPSYWFGKYNSSHGCVGLQNPQAAWIYNWAPVGTPIIIHY